MATTTTISTFEPEDGQSFYDFEFLSALTAAHHSAFDTDEEAAHYVRLPSGEHIAKIELVKETLSDGSVACTIVLHPEAGQ